MCTLRYIWANFAVENKEKFEGAISWAKDKALPEAEKKKLKPAESPPIIKGKANDSLLVPVCAKGVEMFDKKDAHDFSGGGGGEAKP